MQALPSFTASGEQHLSAPPLTIKVPHLDLPPAIQAVTPMDSWGFEGSHHLPESFRFDREQLSSPEWQGIAEGVGLAHDAGNLLGAIRLYCDLLALPGVLRSEHRHYAEELRHLSARSGSLIGRMLQARRWTESAPKAQEEDALPQVRLAEVVSSCRSLLSKIAGDEPLLVVVEAGASPKIAANAEAIERILVNLTKNAAEASDAIGTRHGAITLRVKTVAGKDGTKGGAVSLRVEDCGRGMSEAAMRCLLEGNESVRSAREEGRNGRGIGFQVVRELVAETGGKLSLRSRLGRGTTVEIVWPGISSGTADPECIAAL